MLQSYVSPLQQLIKLYNTHGSGGVTAGVEVDGEGFGDGEGCGMMTRATGAAGARWSSTSMATNHQLLRGALLSVAHLSRLLGVSAERRSSIEDVSLNDGGGKLIDFGAACEGGKPIGAA